MTLSPAFLPIGQEWQRYSSGFKYPLVIPYAARNRHVYILGTTGVGKSTLMRNMILGDIARGHGVTLITPNNRDNLTLMAHIASEHHQRVIYLNAEDTERPVAYNPLRLHAGENLDTKAAQLLTIFRNALSDFSPPQEHLLRNAIYLLLKRPRSTLTDLLNLIDPATPTERSQLLRTADETVRRFFTTEYSRLAAASALPILNRFSAVRLVQPFQLALCQPEGTLNLSDVLNTRKILLLNLSPALGEGNATLLGQFMLAAFQQALELRFAIDEHKRIPHYLYIDEVHLFASENSETLKRLFELGRGLNLGITIIHHRLGQLLGAIQSDALALTNTKIVFRPDENDTPTLNKYLHLDKTHDLGQMSRYYACVRIDTATSYCAMFPEPRHGHPEYQAAIIEASRTNYGRPPQPTSTLATPTETPYNEPTEKPKPPPNFLE